MFENIIGHKHTVELLKDQVRENRLPGSILIDGPRYAGKLTLALELARVLTCTRGGEWNCTCSSCRNQKLLIQNDTLLLGYDNFMEEISAVDFLWILFQIHSRCCPYILHSLTVRKKKFIFFLQSNQMNSYSFFLDPTFCLWRLCFVVDVTKMYVFFWKKFVLELRKFSSPENVLRSWAIGIFLIFYV